MTGRRVSILLCLALSLSSPAYAAKFVVKWVNPATGNNGTVALTDLTQLRITWGSCASTGAAPTFGTKLGSKVVPVSTSAVVITSGVNPVCVYLTAISSSGAESPPSNVAMKTLTSIGKPTILSK